MSFDLGSILGAVGDAEQKVVHLIERQDVQTIISLLLGAVHPGTSAATVLSLVQKLTTLAVHQPAGAPTDGAPVS